MTIGDRLLAGAPLEGVRGIKTKFRQRAKARLFLVPGLYG